jgi:hypothetical protein
MLMEVISRSVVGVLTPNEVSLFDLRQGYSVKNLFPSFFVCIWVIRIVHAAHEMPIDVLYLATV